MARLPVPRRGGGQLSQLGLAVADGDELVIALPRPVQRVLVTLAGAGHEAALVGGTLRDLLRGRVRGAGDWDVATEAHPEVVARLFPGSLWQNRFGTVTVGPDPLIEVTTYRTEGGYRDRRRPDEVRFGATLDEDLARRDFTVNAIAWVPSDPGAGRGVLRDPHGGIDDLRAGVLRAVGDPAERFAEDALRLVRAVRFAARLGLEIEPRTGEALRAAASSVTAVSGERIRDELLRMLRSDEPPWREAPPSTGFRLLEAHGLLEALLPELAALRGVPQGKPIPGDALDHALRAVDALPPDDAYLRLAGLLHDLGKATTGVGGHFIGHEEVGAELARRVAERLRLPNDQVARIVHLVRQHMFAYTPGWTDAAVRRFVGRVGREHLDDLFALRAADELASRAHEPAAAELDELRARIGAVTHGVPLETRQLAIDGHDLQAVLGLPPSPEIGRILAALLEATIEEPSLNNRESLIGLAREIAARAS